MTECVPVPPPVVVSLQSSAILGNASNFLTSCSLSLFLFEIRSIALESFNLYQNNVQSSSKFDFQYSINVVVELVCGL